MDSDTCTKGPVHMGKGNDILKNMTNYCDSEANCVENRILSFQTSMTIRKLVVRSSLKVCMIRMYGDDRRGLMDE